MIDLKLVFINLIAENALSDIAMVIGNVMVNRTLLYTFGKIVSDTFSRMRSKRTVFSLLQKVIMKKDSFNAIFKNMHHRKGK